MPNRKFTTDVRPTREGEEPDPVTFDLDGVGVLTGEPWAESFTCVPVAPAGVLDDMAASVVVDGQGRMTWNQVSLLRFLRGVLLDDDAERLDRLVHDKDRVVELQTLGEITLWLAEELVGPPTTRPSSSGAGRPATGPGSPPA